MTFGNATETRNAWAEGRPVPMRYWLTDAERLEAAEYCARVAIARRYGYSEYRVKQAGERYWDDVTGTLRVEWAENARQEAYATALEAIDAGRLDRGRDLQNPLGYLLRIVRDAVSLSVMRETVVESRLTLGTDDGAGDGDDHAAYWDSDEAVERALARGRSAVYRDPEAAVLRLETVRNIPRRVLLAARDKAAGRRLTAAQVEAVRSFVRDLTERDALPLPYRRQRVRVEEAYDIEGPLGPEAIGGPVVVRQASA